jgi:hypothetical protein
MAIVRFGSLWSPVLIVRRMSVSILQHLSLFRVGLEEIQGEPGSSTALKPALVRTGAWWQGKGWLRQSLGEGQDEKPRMIIG